jgi:hypothetical protein
MEQVVICIIPNNSAFLEIKELMKKYSNELNSSKALIFPPHLTLIGRFKTDKITELKSVLLAYSKKIKSFKVTLKGCYNFDSPKILFLKPEKLDDLRKMHYELLDLIKEFKDPWIRDAFTKDNYSDQQKKYVELYGSPYVKEFYNPHLTLAGPDVNEEKFSEIINSKVKHSITFEVKKINILKRIGDDWIIEEV